MKTPEELANEYAGNKFKADDEGCERVVAKQAFLAGYEQGRVSGMRWMLKALSREVEISPTVLDNITIAYQGLLKREQA